MEGNNDINNMKNRYFEEYQNINDEIVNLYEKINLERDVLDDLYSEFNKLKSEKILNFCACCGIFTTVVLISLCMGMQLYSYMNFVIPFSLLIGSFSTLIPYIYFTDCIPNKTNMFLIRRFPELKKLYISIKKLKNELEKKEDYVDELVDLKKELKDKVMDLSLSKNKDNCEEYYICYSKNNGNLRNINHDFSKTKIKILEKK